jgi:hypothetical protein
MPIELALVDCGLRKGCCCHQLGGGHLDRTWESYLFPLSFLDDTHVLFNNSLLRSGVFSCLGAVMALLLHMLC